MSRPLSSKRRQPATPKRRWLGLLVKLALVGVVLLGGWAIYLDAQVQEKFSGRRWTIPAKVYARPLELFVGQKLTQKDFLTELNALGYRRVAKVDGPGSMVVDGRTVTLNTRGFQFYDGAEQARRIQVQFSGDFVSALREVGGAELPVVRLEPLMIGGVYPAHNEDRVLIQLEDTPPYLAETLMAVEDRDFYQHHGVSVRSIARAMAVNLQSGQLRQGGSTLTQQLVKNFFLTNDRTLSRKLNEAMMAVLLELHYDKKEILESYLNEVFLGQDGQRAVHGFGLASQYFFGQPLNELRLHQVALLVGMVKGPTYYNPRRNPERALERRNLVLDLLVEQGVVTAEQAAEAKAKDLDVTPRGSMANSSYPAFMDLVKRQLREDYREEDLTEEGLRVFTSFDPVLQLKAQEAVDATYKSLGARGKDVETAMTVSNPETGEIQALISGRQAGFAGFNRALDAARPIGSLVKPAIYLTALQQPSRYSLTTILQDEPFTVKGGDGKPWTPQNYGNKVYGNVYLYQALANSYNLSTARLGMDVGVGNVLKTVRLLGAPNDWPEYPSMLLGAGSLTPIAVTSMYQTLANGGYNTPLRSIRNVLTANGEPLKRYPFQIEQRFDAGAVYLTQYALQRVMREGTGRSAYNQLPRNLNVAGKTGTSNDSRDAWFAGYSQDLLAVVWMGRDDNGKTTLTGASGPLQTWTGFMRRADPMPLDAVEPDNIVYVWVDSYTGQGTDASCPGAVQMPYIQGSEPAFGPGCGYQNTEDSVMDWVRGWVQ